MSTQVHVADTSTSENEAPFSSTKFAYGDSSRLAQPPSVVVRARSTTEGIEMNFMGSSRTRQTEPSISEDDDVEPEVNTKKEWTAIASCCLCLFLSGWNDASIGPLLPTIQKYYNLNFTIISLLFVSACLGFMLAGILNVHLSDRIGFGRVMLLGCFCQIASYSILAPAFPFPVMNIAYAINGFGIGLQDAQANGFVGALRTNASAKMGVIHSFYGAGALIAPIIATQFTHHPNWSYQYLAPLAMAAINAVVIYATFGFHTQEELLGPTPIDPAESASNERKYQQIFGSWGVQIMAAFCLLYVGAETTMGGWIVTFIVEERGGGTSAGYASSGFFGGLMLGRVILLWVNEKVGERRAVYAYILLAIGLEMTVWMLPHLFGNAVAFALVGLLMVSGPIYPIGMNVLGTIVPKWLLTGSMGWVASVGQAGGAVFPFITGTLTQKYGVQVLQPILVALLGGIVVSWALVPSSTKRRGD